MTSDSPGVVHPSAPHLCTTRTPRGGIRIHLAGELDLVAVSLIEPAMAAILRAHRPNVVELDLGGTRILSNRGAAVLSELRAMAYADGVTVMVDATEPGCLRAGATSAMDRPTPVDVWLFNERPVSYPRWRQLDHEPTRR